MKSLFLVGYMGCGKSTLGRKLARKLNLDYFDTDSLIETREGASVADLFHYGGETRFREIERSVIEELIAANAKIISTGGGLPTWRDNMARMNEAGITIYLRRSAENISRRLSPHGRWKRPRLRGLSDEELVDFMTRDIMARESYYTQASLIIECDDLSDDDIVNRIEQSLTADL